MNIAPRTYKYPIPGDFGWTAQLECASGLRASVRFYAPREERDLAFALVAPGKRAISFKTGAFYTRSASGWRLKVEGSDNDELPGYARGD